MPSSLVGALVRKVGAKVADVDIPCDARPIMDVHSWSWWFTAPDSDVTEHLDEPAPADRRRNREPPCPAVSGVRPRVGGLGRPIVNLPMSPSVLAPPLEVAFEGDFGISARSGVLVERAQRTPDDLGPHRSVAVSVQLAGHDDRDTSTPIEISPARSSAPCAPSAIRTTPVRRVGLALDYAPICRVLSAVGDAIGWREYLMRSSDT